MVTKLLYLTYISMDKTPTSGSSVRPQKMKEAFDSLGIDVRTFGGINNNRSLRKQVVADVKELLRTWQPDACYIEPPSGPMFYYGDVKLIKLLHKKGIPISIFYRDAYWKYPEYSAERKLSTAEILKRFVIKRMQIYQWNVFRKNIDLIYFPSVTMAKEFECPHKDTLPPGGFVADMIEKRELSSPLQFIFVGGAAKNHGTFLTIEAFEKVREKGIKAKVFYICPEAQWNGLGINTEKYKEWLEVIHTSGDENLRTYYEKADVALLTAPKSFYRDFAVPIKIFEYMSYLKPVLVTNCTETARIVEENHTGWVVQDSIDAVAEKIMYLAGHPNEILKVCGHMEEARANNLWISRSKKVLRDLDAISLKT